MKSIRLHPRLRGTVHETRFRPFSWKAAHSGTIVIGSKIELNAGRITAGIWFLCHDY
jgi:hypothetical protein